MKQCRECGVELVAGNNWYSHDAKGNRRTCIPCRKAYQCQWRKDNPDYHHQWHKANPDKHHESRRRRRALKLSAPVNDFADTQWQAVLDHYGHKCAYCGATEDLTQDHIIPLSRGGWHTISNIAPACRSCNSRKGTRTPAEARMYLWQLPMTRSALDI